MSDIYILREGKQEGPFTEEQTQKMLKEGRVLLSDLAWSPGLEQWQPLPTVLYPAARPTRKQKTLPTAYESRPPIVEPKKEAPPAEPASARQKAFLNYMGIKFEATATKETAALLVNDAMEKPRDPARLARWNDERLTLHPDLFADELAAKKEKRLDLYYDRTQREGADFFEGLTKAHAQVLIGFLDVRHPNWDAREAEALTKYFFPAIAEKFPQLVTKAGKGKFSFQRGPKVADEVKVHASPVRRGRGSSVGMAVLRGVIVGAVILGAMLGVQKMLTKADAGSIEKSSVDSQTESAAVKPAPEKKPKPQKSNAVAVAPKPPVAVEPSPEPAAPKTVENIPVIEAKEEPQMVATAGPAAPGDAPGTPAPLTLTPVPAAPAAPAADAPMAAAPEPTMAAMAPADPAMMAAPAAPAVPVFDPFNPNASMAAPASPDPLNPTTQQPAAPAVAAVAPAPAAPPPIPTIYTTAATDARSQFGSLRLPARAPLKYVAQEGGYLRVKYGAQVVLVPVAATNFAEHPPSAFAPQSAAVPPPPVVPAMDPNTPPPLTLGDLPAAPMAPTMPTAPAATTPAPSSVTPPPKPTPARRPIDDL